MDAFHEEGSARGLVHVVASRADRYGGADVYTRRFVSALTARGWRVVLICHQPGGPVPQVEQIAVVKRPDVRRRAFLWRFSPLVEGVLFRARVRELELPRPDVSVVMAPLLGLWHWRRFPVTPMIYLPHSLVAPLEVDSYFDARSVQRAVARRVWTYLERAALKRASCTVRLSEFARQELQRHYGAKLCSRIRVIPQAVDVPLALPPRTRVPERVHLLFVGRLSRPKNVGLVLEALTRVREGAAWTLDILGDGPERSRLEMMAKGPPFEGRVVFHGHRDDVSEFYDRADLFVFPSLLENAPLVVLEAMAHGVPALVLGNDGQRCRSGAEDFILPDVDGFVAQNESDFARALARLVNQRERLPAAGELARRKVLRSHTWDHHITQWEALLRELTQSLPPRVPTVDVV